MLQASLSMRKIEEVLRLKFDLGLTHWAIAKSCGVSTSTVSEYVTHARAAGLSWPLPEGMTAEELRAKLFSRNAPSGRVIPQPNWTCVQKELKRKGVTLSLLWIEYRQEYPDGYATVSSAPATGIGRSCSTRPAAEAQGRGEAVHRFHWADDAGGGSGIGRGAAGGNLRGYAGHQYYSYAEAQWDQSLPNWIGGHGRALVYLVGVPELLVLENLKSGVISPDRYEPDLNPTYQEFARYYGVAVVPTRLGKPRDKAKVEVGVQVVERLILARLRNRTFFSLAELNQAIRLLLHELKRSQMKHLGQSRLELFKKLDQPLLAPLPAEPDEFAVWKKVRVHIDYHVALE